MIPPGLAIALVLVVLGALMLGVQAAQRRFSWEPELARKSVHVLMGLVCLSFPWLFRDAWAVWLLATGAVLALAAVRHVPQIKSRFGRVLGGVERESWGELLFPLAVAFLFWLARGDALLFCVPVLILSLADATAALIGRRYGIARYRTDDGWKTLEGSVAFFVVAFLSTSIPLWFYSTVDRTECLVIAGVMGLILVLIEAIAWHGLDNLFIPIVSYVCLVRMLRLSLAELVVRFVILLAAVVGLGFWRRTTRLTQSAVIGAALIVYVSWVVGGWRWLIAPIMTAAAYTFLCWKPARDPHQHTVHAIACIGGVGLCWLCLAQVTGRANAIYAYGVGYAANLGMIALPSFADSINTRSLAVPLVKATLLSYILLTVPYLMVWNEGKALVWLAAAPAALIAISLAGFARWQPSVASSPTDAGRWVRQGLISAAASALAFGLISYLNP